MRVEIEVEEAWNLMSHIIGRVLDESQFGDSDRAKVRRWKSDEMRNTSQEMKVLTSKINEDLARTLERKNKSQLRKPDWV